MPANHSPTEAWGAPSGLSQIDGRSGSIGNLLAEVQKVPCSFAAVREVDGLESLSQYSSYSEDRGSADWDFTISELIAAEEKAEMDARIEEGGSIQSIVDPAPS